MIRGASFKKVVRRHAGETGQRYTEALTDLQGLGARMNHEPAAGRLLAHRSNRYGIDPAATTKLSVHKTYVFGIDRNDGEPWVARAFPPARPRAGVEGDAAIPQIPGAAIPPSAWRPAVTGVPRLRAGLDTRFQERSQVRVAVRGPCRGIAGAL
jgi:hypothetical protein